MNRRLYYRRPPLSVEWPDPLASRHYPRFGGQHPEVLRKGLVPPGFPVAVLAKTGKAAEEDRGMKISAEEERAICEGIVRHYGDGTLKEGYLFDQIEGIRGRRARLSEAFPQIADKEVIVLLDRHPNNRAFAQQVMAYLNTPETWAFVISTEQLLGVLEFNDCDLYVTTRQGRLLLVCCHEDDIIGNERTVWLPNPQSRTL